MWRIVDFNWEFVSLPRSPHRVISMKALPARIIKAPRDVTCSCQLRVDYAKNDSDVCDLSDGLQRLGPQIVLKCRLCNQCDTMFEQSPYHLKECFRGAPLHVLGRCLRLSKCLH